MLSAYGDESHDEQSKRVFAVAGLLGRQEEWDELSVTWSERTHGIVFHAAECESDQGDFAQFSHAENLALYADLTRLIARTKLLGIGVAVDLPEFSSIFPKSSERSDQPYFLCFHDVVDELTGAAYLHVPQEKAKFTFDRNLEVEYNATYLYNYMAKQTEWVLHKYMDSEVGFASRAKVEIQVADLVARETFKHLDNQLGPKYRFPRQSILALARTGRFRFFYYGRDALLDMRREAEDLGKLRGAKMSEYTVWRTRNSFPDTFESRMKYLIVIGEMNKLTDRAADIAGVDGSGNIES